MNKGTRSTSILAVVLAAQVGILGLASSTAVATGRQSNEVCKYDSQYLPRTPDAVEGWLHDCPAG